VDKQLENALMPWARDDVAAAFDAYCRPLLGALPKFERL
jgi:hypothetical protein